VYTTGRTPAADTATLDQFDKRVRALFDDVPLLRIDEQHRPCPITLTFDAAAEQIFERYELELAHRRRQLGTSDRADDEAAYLGWLSKLAGQTARLAAIIHAAKHWTDGSTLNTTIGRRSVGSAVALARYFDEHALAVFGLMGEMPNQRLARSILNWLANRQPVDLAALTVRDIHRSRSQGVTAEQLTAALRLLEVHGYVRVHDARSGAQGGRPSTRVEINTAIAELTQSDGQNRQNPTAASDLSVLSLDSEREPPHDAGHVGLADAPFEHRDPGCVGTGAWLARDGRRRCTTCDPPAFPGEVLQERDLPNEAQKGDQR
jgi:hypothetical protein